MLIHHAANGSHSYPSNSLSAITACLKSGAQAIEIDVIPLPDLNFVLLHDPDLSHITTGKGLVTDMRREDLAGLNLIVGNIPSKERVGFLDEALELISGYPDFVKLQLDFKPYGKLSEVTLESLLKLIDPYKEKIQISCVADWLLRTIRKIAPDVNLGFDPLLYLDTVSQEPRPKNIPPFRVGAYGLLDDHPLSAFRWGSLGDYFSSRAEILLDQVGEGLEWFLKADLLYQAYEHGFNWLEFLHKIGSKVDIWTIDPQENRDLELVKLFIHLGVDDITTNKPEDLLKYL